MDSRQWAVAMQQHGDPSASMVAETRHCPRPDARSSPLNAWAMTHIDLESSGLAGSAKPLQIREESYEKSVYLC
jgi:hypothetical protein